MRDYCVEFSNGAAAFLALCFLAWTVLRPTTFTMQAGCIADGTTHTDSSLEFSYKA